MSKFEPPFDVAGCLRIARERFAVPPPYTRIDRPAFRGDVVARFVLPMALCKSTNMTRHAPAWQLGRDKDQLAQIMALQARAWTPDRGARWRKALPGRPEVLVCRFSVREPDAYADFAKSAVDILTIPSPKRPKRLGLLLEDSPSCVTVRQWWERAPQGEGFVFLEVRTGDPEAQAYELTDFTRALITAGLHAGQDRKKIADRCNVPVRVVDLVKKGHL